MLEQLLAIHIEFIGPCSAKPLLQAKSLHSQSNVGEASIEVLERFEVEYQGTERGLNSAFGTATGMDALEIISDQEMRSYGWCYSVDGVVPEDFADAIPLSKVKQRVSWFFAYAHYLNGEWIAQCRPAYLLRPAKFCPP
jgi:hypothetical protein